MIDLPSNDPDGVLRAWLEERPTEVRKAPPVRAYPTISFPDFGINFATSSQSLNVAEFVSANLWTGDMPMPADGSVSRAIADDLTFSYKVSARGIFTLD